MVLNYCPDDSKCLYLLPLHFRCKFVAHTHTKGIMGIGKGMALDKNIVSSHKKLMVMVIVCIHLFAYNKNLPH